MNRVVQTESDFAAVFPVKAGRVKAVNLEASASIQGKRRPTCKITIIGVRVSPRKITGIVSGSHKFSFTLTLKANLWSVETKSYCGISATDARNMLLEYVEHRVRAKERAKRAEERASAAGKPKPSPKRTSPIGFSLLKKRVENSDANYRTAEKMRVYHRAFVTFARKHKLSCFFKLAS